MVSLRRRGGADHAPEGVVAPPLARYEVLAAALAGRRLDLAYTDGPAHTDGIRVFVTPDGSRRQVVVHSLLLGHGSLARRILSELRNQPSRTRRYLLLEINRLSVEGGRWAPLRPLLDVPGGVPLTGSAEESLGLATGEQRLPDPPGHWGVIRPGLLMRSIEDEPDVDPAAASPLRLQVQGDLADLVEEDDSEDISLFLRLLKSPFGSQIMSNMLQNFLGVGRSGNKSSSDGTPAGDQASGVRRSRGGSRGPGDILGTEWRMATGAATSAPRADGYVYPEWDAIAGKYLPEWCTVIEYCPRPTDADTAVVPGSDLMMRRRLARIGLSSQVLLRQPIGDDLDIDAVVRSQVAVASGGAPDESVYAAARAHRRDLSVLVLLDVSGSTRDPSPSGGTVFDRQREAAACLLDSLTALGVRTAGFAFRSEGRNAIHLLRLKNFDDTWNRAVQQRIASLEPGGYTRLGAAIRHGRTVLARETGSKRRLLIVLSDGLPYDTDYQDGHAEADSRRALAEVRGEHIGCLCISIGSRSCTTLEKVFGTAAHANVANLRSLRTVAPRLFVHGLRTSDPRRRLSQHRAEAVS